MKIRLRDGKKVEAQIREFTIQTDQPVKADGDNVAPNPFELFLASIGTCSGYYILAFCRKREIATEEIELTMDLERNEETHLITRISIAVRFPEDFPEQYVGACLKSAEQCTVKKHLQNPPEILLTLAE